MDLAKLLIWVRRENESVEPIVLSVDEKDEVTIAQVAESIAKAFQFEEKLEFDTTKAERQRENPVEIYLIQIYLRIKKL